MKKISVFLTLLVIGCVTTTSLAQNGAPRVRGVDVYFENGVMMNVIDSESMCYKIREDKRARISTPVETTFVDYNNMKFYQMAVLPDGDTVTQVAPFEYNKNLTVVRKDKVLGWECKVATTSVNSNSIEIWYTDNLGYKGTPIPQWGVPDGLVLKVVRNGKPIYNAERLDQTILVSRVLPASFGKLMDAAEYRYMLNNSVVRTVEVFRNDSVRFTGEKAPAKFDKENHLYRVGGGTVILKRVKLPENVDGNSIFAEVSQYALGDAYDRTGSVFVVPVGKELSFLDAMSSNKLPNVPAFLSDTTKYPWLISTYNYDVPVELMRFFTSFGVRGFNHIKVKGQNWADSVIYKADVTHLAPLLKGEVWIGAYIGNWDSRGHSVSLKLKYHPGGRAKSEKVVMPLFNTLNILEQAGQGYPVFFDKDSLRVKFSVPRDLKNAQLVYLTTGHGGWGGGDEFNQKLNTIYLDGKKIFSFIPWREDCASYRNSNPASGNFSNGLSSSDLSRSNWCPGTVTYPVYVPVGDLAEGEHTMSVQIPLGKPDGNSFSYWCISGFLIAE